MRVPVFLYFFGCFFSFFLGGGRAGARINLVGCLEDPSSFGPNIRFQFAGLEGSGLRDFRFT